MRPPTTVNKETHTHTHTHPHPTKKKDNITIGEVDLTLDGHMCVVGSRKGDRSAFVRFRNPDRNDTQLTRHLYEYIGVSRLACPLSVRLYRRILLLPPSPPRDCIWHRSNN